VSAHDLEDQQHSGELPSRFRLLAALEVAALISPQGTQVDAARLSYSQHPSEGLFGMADLSLGEDLLVACGLLERKDGLLIPTNGVAELVTLDPEAALEALLARWIEQAPPSWLAGAVANGTVRPELISSADARALEDAITDPEQREAFLLALGNRVDTALLQELGARGEEFVVGLCRAELGDASRGDLVDDVIRVSTISDWLGYDVRAPATDESARRLEVKTVGGSRLEVHLSRNEAKRALKDPCWALVVVRAELESEDLLGWCRGSDLEPFLPRDEHARGRWESVRIALPTGLLKPGLPPGATL
jgi:Domain of unknown function (DUF3883)